MYTERGEVCASVCARQRVRSYRCDRITLFAIAIFCASLAMADAAPATTRFNIKTQEARKALALYARQARVQLGYAAEVVDDILTNPLNGEYENAQALALLLEGTGLEALYGESGITIRRIPEREASGDIEERTPPVAHTNSLQFAQPSPAEVQATMGQKLDEEEAPVEEKEERRILDEIIVTGTRIQGVKDQFSPVTQVSREDMDLAGFSNVSDVVESLPQNFGGGATIATSMANTSSGPGNASINLRGLGNQATLILLNGRRLAAGGGRGQFVDISTIPASAIDRVDVLTDGASAIYGSDAIAGVVNIILRDDFDGAETRLNVGTITDGGGDYLRAGQTLGWSGDRARALVTYEYSVEDELDSNQKNFAENATEPTWLLPFTQKHSVFASTGARLTDRIKLSADGYFNDRKSKQYNSADTISFFQAFQENNVQQHGGALGLDIELTDDWEATLSGSYSRSEQFSDTIRQVGTGNEQSTVTEILSFDGDVSGSLFKITDEPVKGVAGVHYRSEKADILATVTPAQTTTFDSDKSRDVFAAFAELYAPIISNGNHEPGAESLAFSVAARYEEYDDVGSSFDPKVGLAWSPILGLNLRGTYGTSFRAPRLDELRDVVSSASLSLFVDSMAPDGESVALLVFGNRDDLDPERSRTWTAGFDFAPDSPDGILLRGTYFNTVFRDQVGLPSVSFDGSFRFTNFTGVPVRDVSQETVQDLCARAPFCFNFSDSFANLGDLSFEDVEVLLDGRSRNLSLSKVAGVDFEGRYDLSSDIGDWRFSLGGTLLTTFEQQTTPATPVDDRLNTFANPVDLRLRGSVQWRTRSMTTSVFVNHVGDYIDDEVPTGNVSIDSFTTVDATIRLDLGAVRDTPLTEGAFLSVSILNMLNEDPPKIGMAPLRAATFDAANASPTGRKIGILLTKDW